MPIELHGGFKNLSAEPDIAYQYQPNGQPWSSVSAAHAGTPGDYLAIGKLRFIDIGDGKGMIEYWYKGGIQQSNLIPRYENLDSAASYVAELEAIKQETEELRNDAQNAAGAVIIGLGTYNAAINLATIRDPASTFTPGQVANKPNGSYFDNVVAGSQTALQSPTGSAEEWAEGDQLISRGTKWDRIPKSNLALANLNGTKVENSGMTTGMVIPEIQYLNPRGEVDMLGNGWYAAAGSYGLYELLTRAVVFDTVKIPFSVISPAQITIRVYKSASLLINPNNMTLLAEKIFASGNFNTVESVLQTVVFDDFIRAKAGEYLYVYAQCGALNTLKIKKWDVDSGTAPFRHPFHFATTLGTPWNMSYSTSTLPAYFACSYELILSNLNRAVKGVVDNFGGVTVDQSSGKTQGIYIPIVSYEHPRGESEILGNGTFSGPDDYGLGFFDKLPDRIIFNRVEVGLKALINADITCKIFKSKTVTRAIPSMILLETVEFPSGTFNTSEKALIKLVGHYQLEANDWIYVMFYSAVGSVFQIKRFNADATAPVRHEFLRRLVSTNPWTTTWDASFTAGGYYQTGIRLYNSEVDPAQDLKVATNTAQIAALSIRPVVVLENPRGASEMTGVGNFYNSTYRGFGLYEVIASDIVFNKIEVPIHVAVRTWGTVTVRVLQGSTVTASIGGFTQLLNQTFNARDWNRNPLLTQSVFLDTPVKVAAGQVIYVTVTGSVSGSVVARYWNVDGVTPARKRFLYTTDGATWNTSSSNDYGASIRFSIGNKFLENRILALENFKQPRLTIPIKLYAVVGIELSIYYDAIIFGKDNGLAGNTDFTVEITCAKGSKRERFWRLTAVTGDIGTHNFAINIFDAAGNIVQDQTCTLVISANNNPATAKTVLDVGDSITANINSRIAMNAKKGVAAGGVAWSFIGLVGADPTKSEGHSGWKWEDFTGSGATSPAPAGNPFWNTGTSLLDVTNYRTVKLGMTANFDVISIKLGVNNARISARLSDAALSAVIDQAKILIAAFVADSPAAKIIVQLPTLDINTQYETYYMKSFYKLNIWRIRELLLETFDNNRFNANVQCGQAGIVLDRYYGYPFTTQPVGTRYTQTEIIHSDDVHPRDEGYQQMGDGMYPQILALLQ